MGKLRTVSVLKSIFAFLEVVGVFPCPICRTKVNAFCRVARTCVDTIDTRRYQRTVVWRRLGVLCVDCPGGSDWPMGIQLKMCLDIDDWRTKSTTAEGARDLDV
jgi:hypothetical protein